MYRILYMIRQGKPCVWQGGAHGSRVMAVAVTLVIQSCPIPLVTQRRGLIDDPPKQTVWLDSSPLGVQAYVLGGWLTLY